MTEGVYRHSKKNLKGFLDKSNGRPLSKRAISAIRRKRWKEKSKQPLIG